jgi:hypothetical protein
MRSNIHIYCIGQHTKKNQRSYQYGFLFIHYILVVALVFSGRDYGGKKPHARTNENINLQKPCTRASHTKTRCFDESVVCRQTYYVN